MDSLLPITNLPLFSTATLVLLLTPGPAVLYVVARSVDQGRKAGLISVLGLQTGTFVHVMAATLGLSAILVTSALAFDIVKYLGAAYLVYLGIRKLREKDVSVDAKVERLSHRRIYSQGAVVAVLNPKTALFFFAFLPQFVDPSRGSTSLQFLVLGLIFMIMALTTDGGYALLAGTAGEWLRRNPYFIRAQKYVSGTIYVGLGLTAALASGGRK